ncbi:deoxyribose-phosphate aldolase [Tetragenococcus muriaticus]|uniref:deoxyribose-phosphate aldolase n=1 Tax=Tetragenococcus muriaticus TaxID=64642 RepID=UPI0004118C5F|nr:deoxyribose-phosphate aldolase [Tetragenococcus muriaticus]GMA48009.1 deoxyribose-phosphate aldolase [Tetragenococcus muriaticus]
MKEFSKTEIIKKIQHTDVNPDMTSKDVKKICEDALEYGFDGVMLLPCWIKEAKKYLAGTDINICTALGFPMGGALTSSKVQEMRDVVEAGADQIDFMANISFIKDGKDKEYQKEIEEIVKAANGKVTKIMLEFGMLTQDEKARAAEAAINAGITYLKNSSGWGKGGHATVEDIQLLKEVSNGRVPVKASGGIRDMERATEILNAGAVLLGTSSGVKIAGGTDEALSDY